MRYSVESDGTDPNRSACERRCSMSAHASPPPASINIACTNTLPRSCNGTRSPVAGIRADNELPSPKRSANAPKACSPTWATTWSPPPSTTTETVLLLFTSRVPSRSVILRVDNVRIPYLAGTSADGRPHLTETRERSGLIGWALAMGCVAAEEAPHSTRSSDQGQSC